jgi:hypothetical protein
MNIYTLEKLGLILIFCLVIIICILVYKNIFNFKPKNVENFATLTFDDLDSSKSKGSSFTITKGLDDYINDFNHIIGGESKPSIKIYSPPVKETICDMDHLCIGIRDPEKLPIKRLSDLSGCGWYFKEDMDDHSFPAYGNSKGPFSPAMNDLATGGKWYFHDISGAQMAEDIKRCNRITSCKLSDIFPKKCAWCEVLGKAIPIDEKSKRSKYPDEDEINCFGKLTKSTDTCRRSENITAITNKNGEIIYPEQISKDVCLPENGKMSRGCLLLLAKTVGFLENGYLIKIINKDSEQYTKYGSKNYKKLLQIFDILKRDSDIKPDIEYFGNGNCFRKAVINFYTEIYELEQFGKTEELRSVAGWLVRGSEYDFEKCLPNMRGPYELDFLQRLFKKSGGQPAGEAYPKAENLAMYNGKICRDIETLFINKCRIEINSADKNIQAKSVRKCLGINVITNSETKRPPFDPNIPCNNVKRSGSKLIGDVNLYPRSGVEIFWYAFEGKDFLTTPQRGVSDLTYLGREVRLKLPSIDNNTDFCPFLKYGLKNLLMIIRANVSIPGQNNKLRVNYNTGVAIYVDGKIIMRNWEIPCKNKLQPTVNKVPDISQPLSNKCTDIQEITNTVRNPESKPSYITLKGPNCVKPGAYFEVKALLDAGIGDAYWAMDGIINRGCRNPGCGFKAPSTPGIITITYNFSKISGTLKITVSENCC